MHDDVTLDILDPTKPWQLLEPEPTTFMALWPGENAPDVTLLTSRLAQVCPDEISIQGELPVDDSDAAWAIVIDIPGLPHPVMFWCESARPLQPGELNDPAAEACKFVIGAETILSEDDPQTTHLNLMRLLAATLPESPAVLDVNATMWHPRLALDPLLEEDFIEPPTEQLWIIHAIEGQATHSDNDETVVWLHTHGLARCVLPELEMLEVPASRAQQAASLLNDIAAQLFEAPPPPPGEPFEIGRGLYVTLQSWSEVAEYLEPGTPGSKQQRESSPGEAHTGVRAVICSATQRGQYRQLWTWPQDVLDAINSSNAMVYRTSRATERQAQLAQRTWPTLVNAFSRLDGAEDAHCLVKIAFLVDEDDESSDREHLWFELLTASEGEATAQLIHEPGRLEGIEPGDEISLEPNMLTDWQVTIGEHIFTPDDADALTRATATLAGSEQSSEAARSAEHRA